MLVERRRAGRLYGPRGAELGCHRQPISVEVDGGDVSAVASGRVHEEGPDAAGTDDDDVIIGGQPPAAHRVHGDRHRLRHGRYVAAQTATLEIDTGAGRNRGELGEGAVAVEADGEVVVTQIGAPGSAVLAFPARHTCTGGHQVTLVEPGDVAPGGDDGAGELVTRHDRPAMTGDVVSVIDREHRRAVGELCGVGAADPHGGDFEQQLVVGRHGRGDVLEADVEPAVKARRLQAMLTHGDTRTSPLAVCSLASTEPPLRWLQSIVVRSRSRTRGNREATNVAVGQTGARQRGALAFDCSGLIQCSHANGSGSSSSSPSTARSAGARRR